MRGGETIAVELAFQIRGKLHPSSPFQEIAKVAQSFAAINRFSTTNVSLLFLSGMLAADQYANFFVRTS
jgi:hypothetical protein